MLDVYRLIKAGADLMAPFIRGSSKAAEAGLVSQQGEGKG